MTPVTLDRKLSQPTFHTVWDGSQSLDLQWDALWAESIDEADNLYPDFASGGRDDRPGSDSCLRALRKGDVLVVWKLDRRGRNLAHRAHTVKDLSARGWSRPIQ